MKSLDTVIESFRIVLKNPKIMLIYFTYLLFIFLFVAFLMLLTAGVVSVSSLINFTLENRAISSSLIICMIIIFLIVVFLTSPIFAGMVVNAGKQAVKGKVSIEKAFNEAKKKYPSLLGAFLIICGVYLSLLALFFLLIFSSTKTPGVVFLFVLIIAIILLVIISIIIGVLFFETSVLIFTENKRAVEAVERSFYLGEKKFLSILAALFFLAIISIGINLIVEIFYVPIVLLDSPFLEFLFYIFIVIPINCFLSSVTGILPVVFYYNYNLKKV